MTIDLLIAELLVASSSATCRGDPRVNANIDAVATSEDIKATYRRYLQSLLAVRDPQIDAALRAAIDATPMLDKGPYLEATPPYAPGASLQDLIDEGVLHPGFAALASHGAAAGPAALRAPGAGDPQGRPGRNVVVATGTGSGKTESFLLPILDSLVAENASGGLGPGVRALLLYPMNALANDQMKRLRQVLAAYPDITFGRYTGDTEKDPKKAREMFGDLNIGEPILPNELLSRAGDAGDAAAPAAHQLRDARVPAAATSGHGPLRHRARTRSGGSSSSTRRTSTTAARAPRSRCCCAGSATESPPTARSSASRPRRRWVATPTRLRSPGSPRTSSASPSSGSTAMPPART